MSDIWLHELLVFAHKKHFKCSYWQVVEVLLFALDYFLLLELHFFLKCKANKSKKKNNNKLHEKTFDMKLYNTNYFQHAFCLTEMLAYTKCYYFCYLTQNE